MRRKRLWMLALVVLALAVTAAACGGGNDGATTGGAACRHERRPTPAPHRLTRGRRRGRRADRDRRRDRPDRRHGAVRRSGARLGAVQIDQLNAAGGINGQPVELSLIDTQLDPEQTKAAAIDLIDNQGAQILLVTCDVDFATPAVQEAINRSVLAVSMCIGTDQMGPQRFGEAASWRSPWATPPRTRARRWRSSPGSGLEDGRDGNGQRHRLLPGHHGRIHQPVRGARRPGDGRGVLDNGDGTVGNVASALAEADVDVIATSTAFADLPALVDGIRSLGSETPIICSWACDGTYWNPKGLSNFYLVTYASVAGDDPNPDVQALADALAAQDPALITTGGFVQGAATIDALKAAIEQTGSTDGDALATTMEGFQDVPTILGPISFTPELHAVSGRDYRVMQIQNGELSLVETRAATSPADIGG